MSHQGFEKIIKIRLSLENVSYCDRREKLHKFRTSFEMRVTRCKFHVVNSQDNLNRVLELVILFLKKFPEIDILHFNAKQV